MYVRTKLHLNRDLKHFVFNCLVNNSIKYKKSNLNTCKLVDFHLTPLANSGKPNFI